MKAVVCTRYGPPEVLELRELPEPAPRHNEVRIKSHATAVTSSDCIVRGFKIPPSVWILARLVLGVSKPRRSVLGMVVAGDIDAVGKAVTSFKPGDRVFGFDHVGFGTYAEYKCLRADGILARKPSNLSYEEAAAIPYGGLLALHFLRVGTLSSGQNVLIYGASGAVGSAAVQLAKHFGARVSGVSSGGNQSLLKSLGADRVMDYTKEDFTKTGDRYDLIFIAVGNRVNPPLKADCRDALAHDGVYVSVDHGRPRLSARDLDLLKELVERGILKPVIDRSYALDEIVEAHRYVDAGHKRGNVVIRVTA